MEGFEASCMVIGSIKVGADRQRRGAPRTTNFLKGLGLGLHQPTISRLLEPCLIFGEGRVIASTGTMAKLEFALSSLTPLTQALALSTLGSIVVAYVWVSQAYIMHRPVQGE